MTTESRAKWLRDAAWSQGAARIILDKFEDAAAIDTANYRLCGFIIAAAKIALEDEDIAVRIAESMEPERGHS
jgi:hypothetical protein